MSLAPDSIRDRLEKHRAQLQQLRDQARERYSSGTSGLQVANVISSRTDEFVVELFKETLADLPDEVRQRIAQETAIIAVGGSGRGELAPYSDCDILFLHRHYAPPEFQDCMATLVRDCWDAGIKVGHSVRTPSNALQMARQEPQFATSLVEARQLWGDERIVRQLRDKFFRQTRWGYSAYYNQCLKSRNEERDQFGGSEKQLEPDIKRSAGGLRDIHLIRWIGFGRHGTGDLHLLRMAGAISVADILALSEAHEFLTRIRTELHFAAGRAQEVLTRDEQLRLAELWNIEAPPGRRPVEVFMQRFFQHSTAVADIAARFVDRERPRAWYKTISRFFLTHRANNVFRVGPEDITVVPRARKELCRSLESVLNLFELAGLYGVQVAPDLLEVVREAAPKLPRKVSEKSARTFLSILSLPGRTGGLLRAMFRTGVLEAVIPEVSHARCLLQFNQYHKFTVDEHSFRAIEAAEDFRLDQGPIGAAYRGLKQKTLLHLSLLLHDLGKGFDEDHSEVGSRIAATVAARLNLPAPQTETLVFLVHKHLILSDWSMRRDLTDPATLVRFAREVGSAERMTLLFLHTIADMTAVGPGNWTEWKADVMTRVYDGVMQTLSGKASGFGEVERLRQLQSEVQLLLAGADLGEEVSVWPSEAVSKLLETFPTHYFTATNADQVATDLREIRRLADQQVVVRANFDTVSSTMEYRIYTQDRVTSGLFSRIAGALTAKRLEILAANICTTSQGLVVDSFRVQDNDFAGAIPDYRIDEIQTVLADVIQGRKDVATLLRRGSRIDLRPSVPQATREPTRVVIDNDFSDRFTVLDVFAHDRQGLLYVITSTLHDLKLSISMAKIATHIDQVVDVFYVTDQSGRKLDGESRLDELRDTLQRRIEALELDGLVSLTGVAESAPASG